MKSGFILALPAAFLAGLMLGRWTPAPPPAAADHGRDGQHAAAPTAIAPITGMLRIPERSDARLASRPAADPQPDTDTPSAGDGSAAAEPEAPGPNGTGARDGPSLEARIAWAADAWRVRMDIARDTFLADAGLHRNEADRFDVLMHAMNLRIEHTIAAWVEQVSDQETVSPEDGVRLLHELSGAMVLTYNEMDRALPGTWRQTAGPRFDLLSFVDPSVAMPIVGIEDRLEAPRRRRR